MAKPQLTLRNVKNLALDYTELDNNFINLRDSTINFTGDAGDTRSMDLNDSTLITGLHNIRVTVDEATQKIIIDNTVSDYTQEPMGFVNRTDSTISFNNGTRQFTIAPTTTSYVIFCTGEQYTKTTSASVTIDATTGLYYVYFDASGDLQYKTSFFTLSTETPVAYIYWNNTTSTGVLADERHGIVLDWRTHEYLHRTRGAAFANGFGISNYTTSGTGSSNADAQLDIANGVFFDEDIDISITHSNTPTANTFQQDLQGPARIPVVYHSGSTGAWAFDAQRDYPVKNGTSLVTYNLNTGGTWTTPDATSTHFVAYWVVATNFVNTPVIAIMGQRTDNKLSDATTNNTWNSLDLTGFASLEFRPLYRLIFRTASSYANTPKAYLADVTDVRYQQAGLIGVGGGGITEVNQIISGDTNVTVTDTGTGQIDFTVDGTAVMQVKSTGLTAYRETVYAGGNTSTAVTPNYQNGNIQTFTANSNFALNLPTNMSAGQNLVLIITQDGTGSKVMTPNASYKFQYAVKTLSTAANSIDILTIFYDGSRYLCNLNKGYV